MLQALIYQNIWSNIIDAGKGTERSTQGKDTPQTQLNNECVERTNKKIRLYRKMPQRQKTKQAEEKHKRLREEEKTH